MFDTISKVPTIAKLRIAARVLIIAAAMIGIGYVRNVYLPAAPEDCHAHFYLGQCQEFPADHMTTAELFIASLKFAGLEVVFTILIFAGCALVLFAWPAADSINERGQTPAVQE